MEFRFETHIELVSPSLTQLTISPTDDVNYDLNPKVEFTPCSHQASSEHPSQLAERVPSVC